MNKDYAKIRCALSLAVGKTDKTYPIILSCDFQAHQSSTMIPGE